MSKRYKPYIILGLVILWLIVTSQVASASNIDPAQELSQLLGDPMEYVKTVEAKAFQVLGTDIIPTMTSIMGLVFLTRALLPK